jgi:hypothetical protein
MARHYSTRDFFRQMPNALLASYFQERGLFGDLDSGTMNEGKPGELFAAWLDLPEKNATPWMRSFVTFSTRAARKVSELSSTRRAGRCARH